MLQQLQFDADVAISNGTAADVVEGQRPPRTAAAATAAATSTSGAAAATANATPRDLVHVAHVVRPRRRPRRGRRHRHHQYQHGLVHALRPLVLLRHRPDAVVGCGAGRGGGFAAVAARVCDDDGHAPPRGRHRHPRALHRRRRGHPAAS